MKVRRLYLGQIYFAGHKAALVFAIVAPTRKVAKELARERIRWKHGSFATREIEHENWSSELLIPEVPGTYTIVSDVI
jgi:hypothetical protein